MVYILTTAELLTIIALMIFGSVVRSDKYDHLPLKVIDRLICYLMMLYVAADLLTALSMLEVGWNYLNVAIIAAHTAYHFVSGVFLLFALVKFSDIPFSYAKNYLFARGALYFAFVLEALALCAFVICCILVF